MNINKKIASYRGGIIGGAVILISLNSALFINLSSLTIYYISKIIVMFLIILSLILKRWTKRNVFLFSLVFTIVLSVYNITRDDGLIFLSSFVFSIGELNIKKLVRISLIARLMGVSITFLFFILGFLPHLIYFRGADQRFSLGFIQPNLLFANIFYIILGLVFLRFGKIKIYEISFYYIISFIFAQISGNRTGFYLMFLFLTYVLFCSNRDKFLFIVKRNWWVIFFFVSIALSLMYSPYNNLIALLDAVTAGRINQANYFLNNFPITLFGNKVTKMYTTVSYTGSVHILDNLYVSLLVQQGILITIGVLVSISIMIKKLKNSIPNEKIDNNLIIMLFFIFGMYGLFEKSPLDISYNIFLLYFSLILKKGNNYD